MNDVKFRRIIVVDYGEAKSDKEYCDEINNNDYNYKEFIDKEYVNKECIIKDYTNKGNPGDAGGWFQSVMALHGDRSSLMRSPYNGMGIHNDYFYIPGIRKSKKLLSRKMADELLGGEVKQKQTCDSIEPYYGCLDTEGDCNALIEKARKGEILKIKKMIMPMGDDDDQTWFDIYIYSSRLEHQKLGR